MIQGIDDEKGEDNQRHRTLVFFAGRSFTLGGMHCDDSVLGETGVPKPENSLRKQAWWL